MATRNEKANTMELPVPSLNICLMVSGTRGDIQPFLGLAEMLASQGHRVRFVCQAQYRSFIEDELGLAFYPLAGDVEEMTQLTIEGDKFKSYSEEYKMNMKRMQLTRDIIRSTWDAATKPSPYDDAKKKQPFEADVILSNPITMGHIHVCEALAIPLHLMFPQVWFYGTKLFPHPMLRMYGQKGPDWLDGWLNFISYTHYERILWWLNTGFFNSWRSDVLGLPNLPLGSRVAYIIPDSKVPYTGMWSPALLPTPEDWPEQCRVVGTFRKTAGVPSDKNLPRPSACDEKLEEWILKEPKPIFVGFGSMVVNDPDRLAKIIQDAAMIAKCRVIVQQGPYSKIQVENSCDNQDLCRNIGPCNHDWLLPKTSAVVHHGGAGTIDSGLRHGLPTLACPFFGDQNMWGAMVHRAGVGPAPCPINELTAPILAEKFQELLNPETQQMAKAVAEEMAKENGIRDGIQHFLEALPRDNMLCDVSLMLGENRVAKYVDVATGIKLSVEAAAISKAMGNSIVGSLGLKRHAVMQYNLGRGVVKSLVEAVGSGIMDCVGYALSGLCQPVFLPMNWYQSHGAVMGMLGFPLSPLFMIKDASRGFLILLDRIGVGILNGVLGLNVLYVCDFITYRLESRKEPVKEVGVIPAEYTALSAKEYPKERKEAVSRATSLVVALKREFDQSGPICRNDDTPSKVTVVKAAVLLDGLKRHAGIFKDLLTEKEFAAFQSSMEESSTTGNPLLSFSKAVWMLRTSTIASAKKKN